MWVRVKEDEKFKIPRAYEIHGVYINKYNNITYVNGYTDYNLETNIILGEYSYGNEKLAVEAFERIMTAIINGGSLVDLNKEF